MNNTDLLLNLVDEDFGVVTRSTSKWARSFEHDSLVIDKTKGLFFWNSEDLKGGPLEYLIKVRGLDYNEAIKIINSTPISTKVYLEKTNENIVPYEPLVELFWSSGRKVRDYWYKRLLTDETIDRFRLGYHDGWFTVPLFVNGKFENFQLRRDVPEKKILPWYRKKAVLFNSSILNIVDTVFITEGTVDAILLNQLGYPAISTTLGANWYDVWFIKFLKQKEIYYIADNDKPGIKMASKVAKNLGTSRVKIITFDGFKDKYDTIDFFRDGHTKEEFNELIKNYKYECQLKEK